MQLQRNLLLSWTGLAILPWLALANVTAAGAAAGARAQYLALTAKNHTPPPFAVVDFTYGPQEKIGRTSHQWWQIEVRPEPGASSIPLFALRCLTSRDPLTQDRRAIQFARYLLRIPETGEVLEYRDAHTGRALLPALHDFERYFVPRPSAASGRQKGIPETCEFLGHVLTLREVHEGAGWEPWAEARVLNLDREMLVGTGRNFKDAEGHRLPQKPDRRNYTYIPFVEMDYQMMIEAGINLFTVAPNQEQFVRSQPVFYLRGAAGTPPLRYPADLYRANYIGSVMFMDEPSILMVGDTNVHRTLRYFSDAAALIEKRTRATYLSAGSYGAFALEKALLDRGVNFGDMRLMQPDYPSWETYYDTAFYQMKGGGMGIVHEGRYQLPEFDQAVERFTGVKRIHTARELLQYHYAFLRGGTRPFGKSWGTAIYGQCDPAIAPQALTLAYDMGARYFWFWTSDHEHHVPWPEQLALARTLCLHARQHPRPSIHGPPPKLDTALVIPSGYFLSLENLWWVRALDKEGENEASQKYRRLMQRAFLAVHDCFKRDVDFDITIDDGRPIAGYRHIVRISERE